MLMKLLLKLGENVMDMLNRIAEWNGHKDWDTFIEEAKDNDLAFNIPTYMLSSKTEKFLYAELLPKIKQINFKLADNDGCLMLVRDIITEEINTIEENNDEKSTNTD